MKIVDNKLIRYGFTPVADYSALRFIETTGRLCWRSEDRITEYSHVDFISGILLKKHYSVLEFSNLVYEISYDLENFQSFRECHFLSCVMDKSRLYVGGSLRAWLEFFEKIGYVYDDHCDKCHDLFQFIDYCMSDFTDDSNRVTDIDSVPLSLQRFYVLFQTDRAVTHEFVRHRLCSFLQESQRYIAQADEVEFTKQWWWSELSPEELEDTYISLSDIERTYHSYLRKSNVNLDKARFSAQEARFILPNCTTTKLYVCASMYEWLHIFTLRNSPRAYPQFRELISSIEEIFVNSRWNDFVPKRNYKRIGE